MEQINDIYYESQWNLKLMSVPFAWDISMGEGATIGLFDSGVDASHKDLGWDTDIFLTTVDSEQARKAKYQAVLNAIKAGKHPKILSGWNYVADNDDTYDDYRHGTSLAGIMVADIDGEGIVGVAPKSKIRPYKVMDNRGWGHQDKVAEAVGDAIDESKWLLRKGERSLPVTQIIHFKGPCDFFRRTLRGPKRVWTGPNTLGRRLSPAA